MLRHGMERNLFAVFSLNATWFQSHGVNKLIAPLAAFSSRNKAPMQCEMKMSGTETNVHVLL